MVMDRSFAIYVLTFFILPLAINCEGIRNKSEFSRGGGRRGGRGRHPSGLSGKQIGLWYAAKGKRNKAERELKQVCSDHYLFVTKRNSL